MKPRKIIQHFRRGQVIVEIRLLRQVADIPVHANIADRLPRIRADPAVGKINRINNLMVVDFPAPFGPKNPNTSPVCTCMVKPSSERFFFS